MAIASEELIWHFQPPTPSNLVHRSSPEARESECMAHQAANACWGVELDAFPEHDPGHQRVSGGGAKSATKPESTSSSRFWGLEALHIFEASWDQASLGPQAGRSEILKRDAEWLGRIEGG